MIEKGMFCRSNLVISLNIMICPKYERFFVSFILTKVLLEPSDRYSKKLNISFCAFVSHITYMSISDKALIMKEEIHFKTQHELWEKSLILKM